MAIYHCEVKSISRANGRSATAAAAYRAGEKIKDERTLEVHDYTRKRTVISADLIMPSDVSKKITRSELWNMAEKSEKRKDAKVAREYEIALPAELPREAQRRLALDFARQIADRYHVAADVALHAPDRKGDERNIHAHILTTTRRITACGELGDKTRELDVKPSSAREVTAVRELWAQLANAELERHGRSERIDARTLEAQGIERRPQIHLGPAATQMERRGVATEKGDRNRELAAYNADLTEARQATEELRRHIDDYRQLLRGEQVKAKQADTPTQKPVEAPKMPEMEFYTSEQIEAAYKAIAEAEREYEKQYDSKQQKQIASYKAEAAAKRKELEEWKKHEPQKKLLERQSTYRQRWADWDNVRESIIEACSEAERKARRLDPRENADAAWAREQGAAAYAREKRPREAQIIKWAEVKQKERRLQERLRERQKEREQEKELGGWER